MNWTLARIAAVTQGRILGGAQAAEQVVNGLTTDTRAIAQGQLFVALAGERFDAHDFLAAAVQAGAAGLLVSDEQRLPAGAPAVLVADTRQALGQLAAAWRAQFTLPLIAVTGSNGKTTTKEMIASILEAAYPGAVLATRGNFNNDVGLPLTLLGLHAGHRAAVVEMGMNQPGEIAYLTQLARPTVALVNNAQRAHLQGMGDLAEIAREKGSIFTGLTTAGVAVFNADDAQSAVWQAQVDAAGQRSLRFAVNQPAEVRGTLTQQGLDFLLVLQTPAGEAQLVLPVPGRHNAVNALAATAACLAAGIALPQVVAGLQSFRGVKGRLQRRQGQQGAQILDDTYNANPDSVRAGIDVLASTIGKKILVLGDMGEIGEGSHQCHDEIGGYAKSQGVDRLYALGEASAQAVRNFGEGGRHFCNIDKLIAAVQKELAADTTVLVKGSRFMRMERVADALVAEEQSCC
ncbi:UDP-N-acetylmuramoyl-tripeptide--D-alanyl-D-alanine ligase [Azonexus hydrophilus]|uniref:UDP-N-acetylmuramoyl-tripeptide--D-alanyl-D- alanine ligase n=1 Tax=Azonexus hydrophilus TaxID=418702 RepID=UPI0019660678|nr:UDP-N-acetylmuramoyl-tripeptide--D-alanyl-D-alanine ligase [Azonexus hydrophilus]